MTDKHDLNGDKQANEKHLGLTFNCRFKRREKACISKMGNPCKTIFSLNRQWGFANQTDNSYLRVEEKSACPDGVKEIPSLGRKFPCMTSKVLS